MSLNDFSIIEFLRSDQKRYYNFLKKEKEGSSMRISLHAFFFSFGLHAIAVYRFGQYIDLVLNKTILIPIRCIAVALYHFLNFLIERFYGIYINRKAEIGHGLYIGHFGGIYIGQCHIGKNCSIHQQVRIGEPDEHYQKHEPWIGDNVWIGGHANIKRGAWIEDYATIGVGAMVDSKVKRRSLVMGNPARIIDRNYNNSSLLGL